VEFFQ